MLPPYYYQYSQRQALAVTNQDLAIMEEPSSSTSVKIYRTIQLIGLVPICEDIRRINVDLGSLVLEGTGSVSDLFHPETKYFEVRRERNSRETAETPESQPYRIHVLGSRKRFMRHHSFDLLLSHRLMQGEAATKPSERRE